jgi:GT2 family glycosyltransferase
VVIVAADSGPGLADCVGDVLACQGELEVLVWDNASRDGSIELLQSRHGADARLRVLRHSANLGFGAGANRAAAQAQGDAIFLLNPDCRLAPDALVRLRAIAAAWPGLGLLGPRIVDADGRVETATRRRDPTLRRALATLLGRSAQGVALPPRSAQSPSEEPVDAVSGAAMWLPHEAYATLAGFDEGYFLHCEDLDLCRRVRDAGRSVVYTDAVEILHAKGGSSRHRPVFVAWHKHRGMWRWFRAHDPAARHPLLAAIVWLGLWSHFAATLPLRAWSGWAARRRPRA